MVRYELEKIGNTVDYYLIDNNIEDDDKIINMIRWADTAEPLLELLNNYESKNNSLISDLIEYSALVCMLEDCKGLSIKELLYNCTYAHSEEEFNELYRPYLENAKKKYSVK